MAARHGPNVYARPSQTFRRATLVPAPAPQELRADGLTCLLRMTTTGADPPERLTARAVMDTAMVTARGAPGVTTTRIAPASDRPLAGPLTTTLRHVAATRIRTAGTSPRPLTRMLTAGRMTGHLGTTHVRAGTGESHTLLATMIAVVDTGRPWQPDSGLTLLLIS